MQAMESQFDVCTEDLFNQTIKLEEMEKKAANAESEVSSLRGRLILMEENAVKYEERLAVSVTNLTKTSLEADKLQKTENEEAQACAKQSEENDSLEQQLKDAQYTLTESG